MRNIGSHDHDGSLEHLWPRLGGQHVVDPAQLGVDLEADVADALGVELVHLVDRSLKIKDCQGMLRLKKEKALP